MFQMLGVFAEFERAMIVERVKQGMIRARAKGTKSGKAIGRPEIRDERLERVRASLAAGNGIVKTARLCRVGVSVVQRLRAAA
jgi:DNA invertase Pin-like site-specific DNA recombinase